MKRDAGPRVGALRAPRTPTDPEADGIQRRVREVVPATGGERLEGRYSGPIPDASMSSGARRHGSCEASAAVWLTTKPLGRLPQNSEGWFEPHGPGPGGPLAVFDRGYFSAQFARTSVSRLSS